MVSLLISPMYKLHLYVDNGRGLDSSFAKETMLHFNWNLGIPEITKELNQSTRGLGFYLVGLEAGSINHRAITRGNLRPNPKSRKAYGRSSWKVDVD